MTGGDGAGGAAGVGDLLSGHDVDIASGAKWAYEGVGIGDKMLFPVGNTVVKTSIKYQINKGAQSTIKQVTDEHPDAQAITVTTEVSLGEMLWLMTIPQVDASQINGGDRVQNEIQSAVTADIKKCWDVAIK